MARPYSRTHQKTFTTSRATVRGHLHQESQDLQSTKQSDNQLYLQNIRRNVARL